MQSAFFLTSTWPQTSRRARPERGLTSASERPGEGDDQLVDVPLLAAGDAEDLGPQEGLAHLDGRQTRAEELKEQAHRAQKKASAGDSQEKADRCTEEAQRMQDEVGSIVAWHGLTTRQVARLVDTLLAAPKDECKCQPQHRSPPTLASQPDSVLTKNTTCLAPPGRRTRTRSSLTWTGTTTPRS